MLDFREYSTVQRARQLSGAALVSAALLQVSCVSSTPVTPAPLAPQEQASLAAAMQGRWKCSHTKKESDAREPLDDTVLFAFNGDGTYWHRIETSLVVVENTYRYHLEGRNVVNDSPHGTYRVEASSAQELALFNYDTTTTWYLVRQP